MSHGDDLLEVVGDLHGGVVDEADWVRTLDRLRGDFANSFMIMGAVGSLPATFAMRGLGVGDDIVEQVTGPLANPHDNPWVGASWIAPLRRVWTHADIGEDRLRRSRLWTEAYVKVGVRSSVATVLDRGPDRVEICLIGRGPDYDVSDHVRFGELIPHLARAWRVRRAVEQWQTLASDMGHVLDRLARGVIITDADGAVRYANGAAERLLGSGDAIDATRGRLRAARSADTNALGAIIDGAVRTGVGRGRTAVDAVALPRHDSAPPIAVVAEPLAPAHADRLGQRGHGAILFLSDAAAATRPDAARLQAVYGLTPAEAQVAAHTVDGDGVAATATALNISENTTKTHLKAVFDKVGVTRQAQLVRRVITDVGGLADGAAHGPRGTAGAAA